MYVRMYVASVEIVRYVIVPWLVHTYVRRYVHAYMRNCTTTVCRHMYMYDVSLLSDRQVGSTFFMAEPPEVLFLEYEKGKVHEVSPTVVVRGTYVRTHTGHTYRCVFVQ